MTFAAIALILGITGSARCADSVPVEQRQEKPKAASWRVLREKGSQTAAPVDWVAIPGGSFMMGSKKGLPNEKPAHKVTVKAFEMAKTLVTNRQYWACVKSGACAEPRTDCLWDEDKGDDQPVVCVSWDQAREFSRWAGGRLPSEAEWEYAARSAGKDRAYPWGDSTATCEKAIIDAGASGCGRKSSWPVCSKPEGNTEQGLCDMAGNAYEWLQDLDHPTYKGAPVDGSAWDDGVKAPRVARGGGWGSSACETRASFRGMGAGASRGRFVGLRPVRERP